MYKRKRLFHYLISFVFMLIIVGCKNNSEFKLELMEGFSEINENGITFQWKNSGNIIEGIIAAPTTGWVSVGFNPTEMMKDANFIIGYIENGEVFIRDDYGSWYTSHSSDTSAGGSSDITIINGKEEKGWTIIHFSLPMDTGDEFDQVIKPGERSILLMAYGNSDSFKAMHRKKAKVEVIF